MDLMLSMQYTPLAAIQLARLFEANPDKYYFRIAIQGGGCSGFQYEFRLEATKEEDDLMLDLSQAGSCLALIVDSISAEYLENSVLDYKKDLSGARFLVQNPRAQRVCGCGLSVSFD